MTAVSEDRGSARGHPLTAGGLVCGGEPNRFVAAEFTGTPAGRALDIDAGEERNAIWLAGLGWRVIAVDFSAVAVDRAAAGRASGRNDGLGRRRRTRRPARAGRLRCGDRGVPASRYRRPEHRAWPCRAIPRSRRPDPGGRARHSELQRSGRAAGSRHHTPRATPAGSVELSAVLGRMRVQRSVFTRRRTYSTRLHGRRTSLPATFTSVWRRAPTPASDWICCWADRSWAGIRPWN